jgi:hypothetical protein
MQYFYDGQIRRYLLQTIRVLSNFVVKYGDGTLHRIPVLYGDADRQVASIMRKNSENAVNSIPRMSVYIKSLALDQSRLADSTYVGKLHFRERDIDPGTGSYNQSQGRNYTVERLMPTPFKLTIAVDILTSSTEQKLQVMEQILVLFNPSLELQTTDNYIDWTSLSVLTLNDVHWSSRSVPVGNDTPIDVGTLTLDAPIWISPPVKVKHLGVITKIFTSLYNSATESEIGYVDGLGVDATDSTISFSDLLSEDITTISTYKIAVYNKQAVLLKNTENVVPVEPTLDIPEPQGTPNNWQEFLNQYPGKYKAGSSQIFLMQPNGTEVIGSIAVNTTNNSLLMIDWDADTLTTNTGIDSNGVFDYQPGYDAPGSYRSNSPGTFDAIVNPQTYNPGSLSAGHRFLIIDDIGSEINTNPAPAWGSLVAKANDIIEYTGTHWSVVFRASHNEHNMVWQTNIYTGVQYLWNGISWIKSFEGEYGPGQWRLKL